MHEKRENISSCAAAAAQLAENPRAVHSFYRPLHKY